MTRTKFLYACLILFCICPGRSLAQPIDRETLVRRHTIINTVADPLSSLSVGNGRFAYTVDITGMQSFPEYYAKGVPLGTQSEWGWHSFIDTAHYKFEETLKTYTFNGKKISYAVQIKEPERNKKAVDWFRQNPHRLQLGNLGFELIKKDGTIAGIQDIKNIHQSLDMWTGCIITEFELEGAPVHVKTFCDQQNDIISVIVGSALIPAGRLRIKLQFPYPTDEFADAGVNYKQAEKHISAIISSGRQQAVVMHQLDETKYYASFRWKNTAKISSNTKHSFLITPSGNEYSIELSCQFSSKNTKSLLPTTQQVAVNSASKWKQFWNSGGAVDFSGSTDTRAFELERRIVLSQYLTRIQSAGRFPPQETGLTYNSWFGKPHLEMHWWHAAHFPLWGRTEQLEKSLPWYASVSAKAFALAKRQGFDGLRWQKMTDTLGNEAPSSVGAFLIWQQPHFIYLTELCYRQNKDTKILERYKDLVFATADFMTSYAFYDKAKGKYILGKGLIPAQEKFKAEETFDPTFELTYWYWALSTAQEWRKRLHLPPVKKWDDVIKNIAPLPVQGNKYLFTESATDSYTNPEFRKDHPAVLGALGMMPATPLMDIAIMQNTFNWIWDNWSWKDTWGWDFPLTAMTATRLGLPDKAIDALLMPVQKNTYLKNGHNYQDDRLTLYLPGNGGLLSAIALMCAGYDGCNIKEPGIPKDGKWKVRWEGLKRMP